MEGSPGGRWPPDGAQGPGGRGSGTRKVEGSLQGCMRAPSRLPSGPGSPARLKDKTFRQVPEKERVARASLGEADEPGAAGPRNVARAPRSPPVRGAAAARRPGGRRCRTRTRAPGPGPPPAPADAAAGGSSPARPVPHPPARRGPRRRPSVPELARLRRHLRGPRARSPGPPGPATCAARTLGARQAVGRAGRCARAAPGQQRRAPSPRPLIRSAP